MPQQLEKIFPVSWDAFHRDARALAWRLVDVGPAAIVARELNLRIIETVCVTSYGEPGQQGELEVLKPPAERIVALAGGEGRGVVIVDDLVDTGSTARIVRGMLPKAHFAAVYAKPLGRPLVDTFITEVSQDTWIYFPWDTGLAFQPPLREGGA